MSDHFGNIPISSGRKKKSAESSKEDKGAGKHIHPKKSGKWGRNLFSGKLYVIFLVAVLLLFFTSYAFSVFAIPFAIQKYLPQILAEKSGFQFVFGDVSFNPLQCKIRISNTLIQPRSQDSDKPQENSIGEIELLEADFNFVSLLRNSFATEEFTVSGAIFHITRNSDSSYNFSPLFKKYSTVSHDGFSFSDLPFYFSINNIRIQDSSILFNDEKSVKKHTIEDLTVSLPTLSNFSYSADKYIQPSFSAIINGSPVLLKGENSLFSPNDEPNEQTALTCSVNDLDLSIYAGYLPFSLPYEIIEGKADANLKLAFNTNNSQAREFAINYTVKVQDALFRQPENLVDIKIPLLSFEGSSKPFKNVYHFTNVLLRDPVVIVDHVQSFNKDSHSSTKPALTEKRSPLVKKHTAFSMTLFIADNGKVIIRKTDGDDMYYPVQLSLRNYTNSIEKTDNSQFQGSFRIHAESPQDYSSIIWQGELLNGSPTGELEANDFSLSNLTSFFIDKNSYTANGKTRIQGTLSVLRTKEGNVFSLKNGSLELSDVDISNGASALSSSSIKIAPLTIHNNQADLGQFTILNGDLTLPVTNAATVFDTIQSNKNILFDQIDFTGKLRLTHPSDIDPAVFENVRLQIEKDTDKKTNDLTFSAQYDGGAAINIKGIFTPPPLSGTMRISFLNAPDNHFSHLLLPKNIILSESSKINGSGSFDLKTRSFEGNLELNDGLVKLPVKKTQLQFETLSFSDLLAKMKEHHFTSKHLQIKNSTLSSPKLQSDFPMLKLSEVEITPDLFSSKTFDAQKVTAITTGNNNDFLPNFKEVGKNLSIKHGTISGTMEFTQTELPEKTVQSTFELECDEFKGNLIEDGIFSLSISFPHDGKLVMSNETSPEQDNTGLKAQLASLHSDFLHSFFPSLEFKNIEGIFSGNVRYSPSAKTISGDLQIENGSYSMGSTELIRWKDAIIANLLYSREPFHISADSLSLDEATGQFSVKNDEEIIPSFFHNLSQNTLLQDNLDEPTSHINLKQIAISHGILELTDVRVSPPLPLSITSINGNFSNLKMPLSEQGFEYNLTGLVQNSEFSTSGSYSYIPSSGIKHSYSFSLSEFPLESLKEQVTPEFSVPSANTSISVQSSVSAESQTGSHELHIGPIDTLVNENHEAALTAALLTDNQSFITTTFTTPQADHLLNSSIEHFQKLKVKSMVSPFLVLPETFQALNETPTISFNLGDASLQTSTSTVLDTYASLLLQRPRLSLLLESITPSLAEKKIVQTKLDEEERKKIAEKNAALLQEWQKQQQLKASEDTPENTGTDIAVTDIPVGELNAFTPLLPQPQLVTDQMIESLARKRLNSIKEYLVSVHSISEKRVIFSETVETNNKLSSPQVNIQFDLFEDQP